MRRCGTPLRCCRLDHLRKCRGTTFIKTKRRVVRIR
jgi:hypothetical protein